MKNPTNKFIIWLQKDIVKTIGGYLLTVIGMVSLTLIAVFLSIPNPNMVLIMGLTVFTALFGYGPGLLAALDMILYSFYFFSDQHSWIRFQESNFTKMLVILIGVIVVYVFVGELHRRHSKATKELRLMNQRLQEDNVKLQATSYTDPLTGISNRFAYRRDIADLYGNELFVAVLDIDDFKQLNDAYGHPVGDHVLRKVAHCLQESFGQKGVYRYGGDEFLLVISNMSLDQFESSLSKTESLIGAPSKTKSYERVTCSVGYVYGTPQDEADMLLMLAAADHNLYRVKNEGKAKHIGNPYSPAEAASIDKSAHSRHYDPRNENQ